LRLYETIPIHDRALRTTDMRAMPKHTASPSSDSTEASGDKSQAGWENEHQQISFTGYVS
jgi:hypothetical protein